MAAALTVRMEMLVAPAEPCPRQPDRVDAEGQRREQPSQPSAEPARALGRSDPKIGELGDIREALENEDRRTRAGKNDAVARFWRNAPAARPLSLMSCCGKGECLRGTLVNVRNNRRARRDGGMQARLSLEDSSTEAVRGLAVVAGYQTEEFGGRDRIHLRKYRLAVLGFPANRFCLLCGCKRVPGGVVP